jgi:hypothetical protein
MEHVKPLTMIEASLRLKAAAIRLGSEIALALRAEGVALDLAAKAKLVEDEADQVRAETLTE